MWYDTDMLKLRQFIRVASTARVGAWVLPTFGPALGLALGLALCLASGVALTGDVFAQAAKPPALAESDSAPTVLNYLLLALLTAAVVGASVFPTKRGHQD